MKFKYLTLLFILQLFSCQKSQEYYEGLYIIGAEQKNPVASLTIDELPSAIGVNVAASCTVNEDVTVDLKANPSLVSSYNQIYKKNYELLPESCYELDNTQLTIVRGKHASSDGLRLRITSRKDLQEGKTYVLPISISNVSDKSLSVIEGSKTLYIVINQIIVTKAADLTPSRAYFKVDFRGKSKYETTAMASVTFEARVRFKKMKSKWCYSVMGLEENLCLRTSGNLANGWKLQIGGGAGVGSVNTVPQDKWVHLACVYNGDTGKTSLYIDGVLEGEVPDKRDAGVDLTYAYGHDKNASFYIGQSAADNRYMEGYVSEARVWAVARTAAELKNNVCWVDPLSEGLVAYWRFNQADAENSKKVTDLTGNGYNAVYTTTTLKFVEGVRCPDE